MSDEREVLLSVIVRVVGGGVFVERCLSALMPQVEGRAIEVIVPYDSSLAGLDALKERFPSATLLDIGTIRTSAPAGTGVAAHELYDRRTAHGLRVAQGRVVAILEDYGIPDPDWCGQILTAHELPFEVIGGAVEHSGSGALNWAVYFLDFGRYQLPLPEGPADYLTDVNISYKRSALDIVRKSWWDRYNEVAVNWSLARIGVVLWRNPAMVVRQDRGDLSLRSVLAERVAWGRLFGSVRAGESGTVARLLYIVSSPAIPLVFLARTAKKTIAGKRNRMAFLLSLPQFLLVTFFWCLGEASGYLVGEETL